MHPGELQAAGADEGTWGGYALRVLVVDDERDAVLTLMALLSEEGYETRPAYRGQDALDTIRDFAPHAVLLDIGMPGLNGYEVARKIRERYSNHGPMLIAVTGRNQHEDKRQARLAGFNHHLPKPYEPHALLALLKPLRTYGGPEN